MTPIADKLIQTYSKRIIGPCLTLTKKRAIILRQMIDHLQEYVPLEDDLDFEAYNTIDLLDF